jgi:hypothetical protein
MLAEKHPVLVLIVRSFHVLTLAVEPKASGKSLLFLKKKKQKDFYPSARAEVDVRMDRLGPAQDIKVFWFFSSEKNILPHPQPSPQQVRPGWPALPG